MSKTPDWDSLLTALSILEAPTFDAGKWCQPPGTVGYFELSEDSSRALDIIEGSGVMDVFDWGSWASENKLLCGEGALDSVDLDTARKLITTHVRSDRFCEGHLGEVLASGRIKDILLRVKALRSRPAAVAQLPQFDLNDELVARALPLVAEGLQKYQRIQRELHRCDVSTNTDFQRWFAGFYRVRRNAEWRQHFFSILEAGKSKPTEFVEVLRELQSRTGRIEASFASKLVATLDPALPVIDSIVLHNLGLRLPPFGTSSERRIEGIATLHQQLRATFSGLLASSEGRRLVNQFSVMYPNAGITEMKMLDLVLWQSRDAPEP